MDVLSDVVTALRSGRPHSARTERKGQWAVSHPRFDGAGFHVVLQGSCWLDTDTDGRVPLGPGDVVFLPRGAAHAVSSAPDAVPVPTAPLSMVAPVSAEAPGVVMLCGAYGFDPTLTHPVLHTLPDVVHLPTRLGQHRALRAAVELLGDELARPRPGADAILPSMLDVLLLYVVRAWYEQQGEGVPWALALRDPVVNTALQALHEAPAAAWTVESLGRRVGLSRAAFARRFADVVGQPPLAYLTRWRLTLAAALLREQPDAPLAAVGRRVGYSSEYAFAAAFKRAHGIAPGRYRTGGAPSLPAEAGELFAVAPELHRLHAIHAPAVLAFELANRAYFAASVSDRGDAYFAQFTERLGTLLAEQEAGTGAYYVLVAENASVLGRFNLILGGDGTAELGYRVAQHVAGRGVATETVRELCRLAATRHRLRTLRAAVSRQNTASQRVLTKAGFVPVGSADPAHLGGKQGTWYQRDLTADHSG